VSGPIAEWDAAALESNWMRQVSIPLAVSGLQIEVDPVARKAVRDVSIRAVSLQAAADTPDAREAPRGALRPGDDLFHGRRRVGGARRHLGRRPVGCRVRDRNRAAGAAARAGAQWPG